MNRITNMSIVTRLSGNINRRLSDLSKIQTQLATGERVSKAEDDPLAANRILGFKTAIAETKQLARNTDDAVSWARSTDLALGDVGDVLQRVRYLAMAAGGVTDVSSRNALVEELKTNHEHLFSIANSSYDGERYLFSGDQINQRPFIIDVGGNVIYQGNNAAQNYEIVQGSLSAVNISGQEAFTDPDLFVIITDLQDAILANEDIGIHLALIDEGIDDNLQQRAITGARMNRFSMTLDRYADEELNFDSLLSYTQDVDLVESLMKYTMMENTYQAALSTAARALQPTLLDYIR